MFGEINYGNGTAGIPCCSVIVTSLRKTTNLTALSNVD
jgi:hypothetical protein